MGVNQQQALFNAVAGTLHKLTMEERPRLASYQQACMLAHGNYEMRTYGIMLHHSLAKVAVIGKLKEAIDAHIRAVGNAGELSMSISVTISTTMNCGLGMDVTIAIGEECITWNPFSN